MGYLETTDLAHAASFRARLTACIVSVAGSVLTEDQSAMSADRAQKRHSLARGVLGQPEIRVDEFIWPVLSNVSIAASGLASSDGDLQYQVGQVWDLLAGVTAADLA